MFTIYETENKFQNPASSDFREVFPLSYATKQNSLCSIWMNEKSTVSSPQNSCFLAETRSLYIKSKVDLYKINFVLKFQHTLKC